MPKTTHKTRHRPRTGYINVELTPDERAKLERLRDARSNETGLRYNLSAVFREWLHSTPDPTV